MRSPIKSNVLNTPTKKRDHPTLEVIKAGEELSVCGGSVNEKRLLRGKSHSQLTIEPKEINKSKTPEAYTGKYKNTNNYTKQNTPIHNYIITKMVITCSI